MRCLVAGMRIIVCGGRGFDDREAMYRDLDAFRAEHGISFLIEGGQVSRDTATLRKWGADFWAKCWRETRGVPGISVRPDWILHGRAAGPIRNQRMIDEQRPDALLCAPGGRGTADMRRRALKANLPVFEICATHLQQQDTPS